MSAPFTQPQTLRTGAASMTQLPPSPDPKGPVSSRLQSAPNVSNLLNFSLGDDQADRSSLSTSVPSLVQRLRAVAQYQKFYPQALACSDILAPPGFGHDRPLFSTTDAAAAAANAPSQSLTSSLGAIAGPQGVALFFLSRPHVPLLLLSHATNTSSRLAISSLAFQSSLRSNDASHGVHLAAARGSGVLVWDVSGHSLSPLISRIGADSASTGGSLTDAKVTSLAWKQSSASPILMTTTSFSLCLWDLRSQPSNSSSGGSALSGNDSMLLKPALRFDRLRKAQGVPFVQVACSDSSEECATIDSGGTVRVYDIRMTARKSGSAVSTFSAFDLSGVGISYFPLCGQSGSSGAAGSSWLTWGLDASSTSAVVKIWSSPEAIRQSIPSPSPDDYWYMDSSSISEKSPKVMSKRSESSNDEYHLVAKVPVSNLACARVCSRPIENSFVAISHLPPETNDISECGGWKADLYKFKHDSSGEHQKPDFNLKRVVSFFSGSSLQDVELKSILKGKDRFGALVAAELGLKEIHGDLGPSGRQRLELLVCSLNDKGIVTTNAIPEALPEVNNQEPEAKRMSLGNATVKGLPRTAFSGQDRTIVYPDDRREASPNLDPASLWQGFATTNVQGIPKSEDSRSSMERAPSPQKMLLTADSDIGPKRRHADSGSMPFEMEVAYGSVSAGNSSNLQISGVGETTSIPSVGIGLAEDNSPTHGDKRDVISILHKIDTERIPCPRLCGATFGSGNGGLAIFQNGGVKPMWLWYSGSLAGGSSNAIDSSHSKISGTQVAHPLASQEGTIIDHRTLDAWPRTLKDLVSMTVASKEAQWGEPSESNSSSSNSTVVNYFEDDASSLDDSSVSGDEAENLQVEGDVNDIDDRDENPEALQEFRARRLSNRSSKLRDLVGPSSDMLAPFVGVTHAHDAAFLNNQSIALAKGWKLGDWSVGPEQEIVSQENAVSSFDTTSPISPPRSKNSAISHYQYLLSPTGRQNLSRHRLDHSDDDKGKAERPYRAGNLDEQSLRPNMEESMTFLRKLFSHQQANDGRSTVPTLLSPPDSPQLSNSMSGGANRWIRDAAARKESKQKALAKDVNHIGVHTIRPNETSDEVNQTQNLAKMISICLHNADVCDLTGETGKHKVWKLLAQTIENQLVKPVEILSGWNNKGCGALGRSLVANLLKYYESLGDVQMLASMFCVLRGCSSSKGQPGYVSLLPTGQDEKYDAYIRRYADILYSWGLLNHRAELNKHLIRSPSLDVWNKSSTTKEDEDGRASPGNPSRRSTGIAVTFGCPRCGRDTDFNSNVCLSCRDFAFRCSICDNAVRGLFMVCAVCGHGGHAQHLKSWFAGHTQCPTGCGCSCSFAPILDTSTAVPENGE